MRQFMAALVLLVAADFAGSAAWGQAEHAERLKTYQDRLNVLYPPGTPDDLAFRILREQREYVLAQLEVVQSERRARNERADALSADIDRLTYDIDTEESYQRDAQNFLDTQGDRPSRLEKDIERLEATADRTVEQDNQLGFLRGELDNIRGSISRATADVDRSGRELKRLTERKAQAEQTLGALARDEEAAAKSLSFLGQKLNEVEVQLARLLTVEKDESSYRQWISAFFAALVAIVILGFFVVAMRNQEIALSIFQNQAGLQFITLFSLVIAIILFGVLNILEGKELSALLGAISGYVLGRAASGQAGEQVASEIRRALGRPPEGEPPAPPRPAAAGPGPAGAEATRPT